MEWAPMVFSIVGSLFGITATALMGMAVSKLNGVHHHLEQLNGRVFAHLTANGIHESAVAKIDEQIKNLLHAVQIAHERIDSIKGRG